MTIPITNTLLSILINRYIIHYLRKNKQDIQVLKSSTVFKLVYRRSLRLKKNDMDVELRVIYEDDPDFYRISVDLPIFSTPSKVLSTRIESVLIHFLKV